jgi:hypothetical protein
MRNFAALALTDEPANPRRLGDLPAERSIDRAASDAQSGRAIATRINTWVSAWKLHHSTASAEDDAVETTARFMGALSTQVWFLRKHLSADESDRVFEVRALLGAASALPAIDPNGALVGFAEAELARRGARG